MGKNLTKSRRLQVVLGTPLSNYAGKPWVLVCACRDCATEIDLVETETLVLHPFNPDSQPLVILAASLLQVGKPQSVAIQQPVVIH